MYYYMEVTQGSDFEVFFNITDPDTQLPLDITAGYTVTGKIAKTGYNDSPTLYTWPIGVTGLVKEVGVLRIRIPGVVSGDWSFERVVYGIKIVNTATSAEVMGIQGDLHLIHTVK